MLLLLSGTSEEFAYKVYETWATMGRKSSSIRMDLGNLLIRDNGTSQCLVDVKRNINEVAACFLRRSTIASPE